MQILVDALVFAVLVFSAIAIAFLIVTTVKAMRTPSLYYPSSRKIEELANELMCPKCGLKKLKPTGHYTLKCEGCGFTFNVGILKLRRK